MTKNKFAMFILSHGRADRIYTLKLLESIGYTGDWFIVIDNEDKTAQDYYDKYGDKVIMFDKLAMSKTFDYADNFNKRHSIVYARNACFKIAEDLGYTHFMELDDDYMAWSFRYKENGEFKNTKIRNMDYIIELLIDFYETSNADCVAFAQGGDYIGGGNGNGGSHIFIKRKAMNTLLLSPKRPLTFLGNINEDVNTYVREGSVGKKFFSINLISITQKLTQSNEGGMSTIYAESGTYVKSFYTVLYHPSSVKINRMGNVDMRIHHKIRWKNTVPMILDPKFKKNTQKIAVNPEI